MRYFAKVGAGSVVERVICADSLDDCINTVGVGWWVETFRGFSTQRYAKPGQVYVPTDPRVFLSVREVEELTP